MTRIVPSYNSYTQAGLSDLSKSPRKNSKSFLEKPSQNETVNNIEKHISDVKSGNGDLSKDVANLLGQQNSSAFNILSQTNLKALKMYSGYISGFRYDRAARFVNAIEYSLSAQIKLEH